MFNFRRWKLQTKLLVPILLVVILALGITWATVSIIVTNSITSQIETNLVDLCSSTAESVGHVVKVQSDDLTVQSEKNVAVNAIMEMAKWDRNRKEQEYKKSINFAAYKNTAASSNFYLTRSWLDQLVHIKGLKEVMVMDINGMTFCATNELTDPNNATDDWFQEAVKNYKEKGTLCTLRGPEYDESADDFDIYMTSPIRRSGENAVYGWISVRYPVSEPFGAANEANSRTKASGSDKSLAWCSKDFTLVAIMETYRVGTNIGPNPNTGNREIKYHLDKGDWEIKDDKVFVKSTGKEYKTESSTLVDQIKRYRQYYKEYDDALAKLDPNSKTYSTDAARLQSELRKKSFEFGVSSQGISRAYSVEFLGEHLGLGDLGFIFVRQTRSEFMTPVINIGYILFVLILILLIVTILILILIARSLINPILILRGSLVEVSLGNYNIQVPVTTQDEVGDLANTFNQMLTDIKQYIVSEEERNIKDREIGSLINTLSQMASGDLAVRADVPPDEIGALADSVNYLAEQLADKVQTEEQRQVKDREIGNLINTMSQMASGDLAVRAEVPPDEIGALADSVNYLAEQLADKIQSEEAKEQQDKQIANLLTTVSEMSTGDLTQNAEVTADVLGAVADSVNYMGDQIRKILVDVTNVTQNISQTSTDILSASDVMSKDATEQQTIITDTSAAVDEMAISINQVSQSAESAAQAAENSAKIAEVGGKTVEEAVDAMNRIRGSVAEISKRIKKLGESSQEIGEIVNVISDIAAQTNMLALNAAIEAARAGEQGRGFSVVADAVRQLAERSTKSTKDITLLIRGIQSETSEAIKTMEDSTQEVVEGSKLAETARDRLEEIVNNSKQLADLISSISLSSRQQSRATEEVNKSMGLISTITNSSTRSIINAARSVGEMNRLVDELGNALKRFKL
jgi:methyl-accepting chemotaxis protein